MVESDIEAQLTFYDEGTYEIFSDDFIKPVILKPNPGAPRLSLSGAPKVTNAQSSVVEEDSRINYLVADKRNVEVSARVRLISGLFGYPMFACIVDDDSSILSYGGYNVIMSRSFETHNFSITLDCATAEAGKTYTLMMGYDYGSNMMQIDNKSALVTFSDTSAGIGNVNAGSQALSFTGDEVICGGCHIEIFNMQGTKVAEGDDSVTAGSLSPGVYVAHACGEALKFVIH